MAELPKIKVDPKHPDSHPGWKNAVKKGKANLPKLKFENEAQKSDYLKAVAKNPNNVPGLPIFYPPESLGTFTGFAGIDIEKKDMLPCGRKWIHASYSDKGEGTYKCFGCNCNGYKENDLTVDKPIVNA